MRVMRSTVSYQPLSQPSNHPLSSTSLIPHPHHFLSLTLWYHFYRLYLCRFLPHLSLSPSLYHLLLVLSHRYEFYRIYLCRFGDLLTDMEANGIRVDETHLRAAEVRAREEREAMQKLFIEWAAGHCEDAAHINTASPAQIGMLLFGEWENGKRIATEKTFKIGKDDEEYLKEHTAVLLENPYAQVTTSVCVCVCVFTSTYRTLTLSRPFPS